MLHSGDNLQKRNLANLQLAWGLWGLSPKKACKMGVSCVSPENYVFASYGYVEVE